MRLIVIDTETTGLSPDKGDRILEIGAIAIEHNQIQMNQIFHHFIDPKRDIPPEVARIHGIDAEKLAAEHAIPFADVGRKFIEFIAGATLVFHNAPFDLGFIKKELAIAGLPDIDECPVIDTLLLARKIFPQQANNLDALCDRLHIERSQRKLHGALIDATLTAQVYLAMTNPDATPPEIHDEPVPDQKISELILNAYDELEYRHSNRISSGKPGGELITITGKSRMQLLPIASGIANYAAFHAKPSASVMIFSLEVTALDWTIALLASEAHINPDRMRTGNLRPKDWRKLATASGQMMDGTLHICDLKTMNMADIRTKCSLMHRSDAGLGLVIIDDLQAVTANETGAEQNTDEITRALKSLAIELGVPVILLSRLDH